MLLHTRSLSPSPRSFLSGSLRTSYVLCEMKGVLIPISLLFVFVRRQRQLAALDPLTMRERSDTNKKFHYLRTWYNYTILCILITAYCGMISYNAAVAYYNLSRAGFYLQTILLALDTISLAVLIFVIARLHKRSREEVRLRRKAVEAGDMDVDRERYAAAYRAPVRLLRLFLVSPAMRTTTPSTMARRLMAMPAPPSP